MYVANLIHRARLTAADTSWLAHQNASAPTANTGIVTRRNSRIRRGQAKRDSRGPKAAAHLAYAGAQLAVYFQQGRSVRHQVDSSEVSPRNRLVECQTAERREIVKHLPGSPDAQFHRVADTVGKSRCRKPEKGTDVSRVADDQTGELSCLLRSAVPADPDVHRFDGGGHSGNRVACCAEAPPFGCIARDRRRIADSYVAGRDAAPSFSVLIQERHLEDVDRVIDTSLDVVGGVGIRTEPKVLRERVAAASGQQ